MGGVGGTDRSGECSPLERGHAVFEHLHEGEDPVVAENHALRQAEVELLHPHQPGHECLGSGQQHVKQIQELFLRFIWRESRESGLASAKLSQMNKKLGEQRSPY